MKRCYLLHRSLVGFIEKRSGYKATYHSMGKPGIAFGSRHLAWETSENMGCDLWQRNFSNIFSLFS